MTNNSVFTDIKSKNIDLETNKTKFDFDKPSESNTKNDEKIDIIYDKNYISETQIGIINIGNTCFINSILQILFHTPIFLDEFLKHTKEIKKMPMTVCYNLLKIYENLSDAAYIFLE